MNDMEAKSMACDSVDCPCEGSAPTAELRAQEAGLDAKVGLFSPVDLARFWSKVEVSHNNFECWDWKGGDNTHGYGQFRGHRAHRIAYTLVNGVIPVGLDVRHTCDNRLCCNPNHLLVGTRKDNMQDAIERGRIATRDSGNGNAKLTSRQCEYIIRNPDRKTGCELARMHGVAQSTISYIRNGRRRPAPS